MVPHFRQAHFVAHPGTIVCTGASLECGGTGTGTGGTTRCGGCGCQPLLLFVIVGVIVFFLVPTTPRGTAIIAIPAAVAVAVGIAAAAATTGPIRIGITTHPFLYVSLALSALALECSVIELVSIEVTKLSLTGHFTSLHSTSLEITHHSGFLIYLNLSCPVLPRLDSLLDLEERTVTDKFETKLVKSLDSPLLYIRKARINTGSSR
jgi:hypothetical protein